MSELTDRLRQVAGQATPGPWAQDDGRPWVWNDELCVASGWREDEARFVATFDPVLVAAMLDVIDAVLDIAPGYDGAQGPYLEGVRTDEMQAVNNALARFREVVDE